MVPRKSGSREDGERAPPPTARLIVGDGERPIAFPAGRSVRDILDATATRVRSACGGIGACGLCRVRVIEGIVDPPTPQELSRLPRRLLERGVRLACQLHPRQDLRIVIEAPAPKSRWQAFAADERFAPVVHAPPPAPAGARRHGVSVDLGTTHIRVSLWDRFEGRRVAGRTGLNPQARFGADVLTRLEAAMASEAWAEELGRLVRDAVGQALRDLVARDLGPGAATAPDIGEVVVVGNTAMLALFTGNRWRALLDPEFWMAEIDCGPDDVSPWREDWGLAPDAGVHVVAPLAGFVGSDLLAGVLATGLTEGPPGALFIDFGTNTEMALWDGTTVWVTSAAGGPAFEGCGIGCGMPAEPGAVVRVTKGMAGGEFELDVLGGGVARGLCGSALVDLVACLRRDGRLKVSGRFAPTVGNGGIVLQQAPVDLVLGARDVDVYQRAKAAVGAGIACLLDKAGFRPGDLRRVCAAGAFGRFLDVINAQETGLLPSLPVGAIEVYENTALAGCERLLFAADRDAILERLKARTALINLSMVPEFEDRFIDNLRLQAMDIGRGGEGGNGAGLVGGSHA